MAPTPIAELHAVAPTQRSSLAIAAVLTNNVIGAGLLALPYVFKRASLVPGAAALGVTGVLNLTGVLLLARCCAMTGATSYKDLVLAAWGPRAAAAAAVLLALYTLGSCVSYLVLLGDALPELVHFIGDGGPAPGATKFFTTDAAVVPLATAVVIMPLCLLRDLSSLRFTSVASFAIICYTALLVFVKGVADTHAPDVVVVKGGVGMFVGLPISLVALTCHYNIPRFYAELAPPPPASGSSKARLFALLAIAVYIFTIVVYESTAASGYLLFGAKTQGDVLENFSNSDVAVIVARVGLVLLQVFSFPIVFNSHRVSVEALLPRSWQERIDSGPARSAAVAVRGGRGAEDAAPLLGGGGDDDGSPRRRRDSNVGDVPPPSRWCSPARGAALVAAEWPHVALTFVLLVVITICALVLPDLAAVLGYKGALGGTIIVYILPSSMHYVFTARALRKGELRRGRGCLRCCDAPSDGDSAALLRDDGSPASTSPGAASVATHATMGEGIGASGLVNTERAPTPLLWGAGDDEDDDDGGWGAAGAGAGSSPTNTLLMTPLTAPPEGSPLRGVTARRRTHRAGRLARALLTTPHGALALAMSSWGIVVMALGVLTTAGIIGSS